jgi:hypothetical protein
MKILLLISLYSITLLANNYQSLLFHGNCTTCHFETKTVSAPSMIMVRDSYIKAFPDKKEFVSYMSTWVHHPNKDTSLMDQSIKKHGLMPELAIDLDTLREISTYIYNTDFKKSHKGHK